MAPTTADVETVLAPGETLRAYRRRVDLEAGRRPRVTLRHLMAGSLPLSILAALRGAAYYRANPHG